MSANAVPDWKPAALEPTSRLAAQVARYAVVGLVAFLADFAALLLLVEVAGLHWAVAAAAGFLVGLAVNYALSVLWVFDQRCHTSRTAEFLVFAAVGAAGLLLTEAVLWLGANCLAADYRLSKVVAVGAVFAWNFTLRKTLLFRGPAEPNPLECNWRTS